MKEKSPHKEGSVLQIILNYLSKMLNKSFVHLQLYASHQACHKLARFHQKQHDLGRNQPIVLFQCDKTLNAYGLFLLGHLTLNKIFTSFIIFTFHFRWIVYNVINTTRSWMLTTTRKTFYDFFIRYINFDYMINADPFFSKASA